jgi:site-specific DNA-methyltransferase (adenine-specific)
MIDRNTIHEADLFDLCAQLDAGSVDMILADLPYGTTACSWDTAIPFDPMWAAFRRIIKPRGAIVLTASQPFTSALVMSNVKNFREEIIWDKKNPSNFLWANRRHMLRHENVLLFSFDGAPLYHPIMRRGLFRKKGGAKKQSELWNKYNSTSSQNDQYFPSSIVEAGNTDKTNLLHPTQKPVALFEYLIRTYTQPGELVFDPTAGSGTTAVAARQTGRHYIVGDSSPEYVAIMRDRLAKPYTLPMLELEGQ